MDKHIISFDFEISKFRQILLLVATSSLMMAARRHHSWLKVASRPVSPHLHWQSPPFWSFCGRMKSILCNLPLYAATLPNARTQFVRIVGIRDIRHFALLHHFSCRACSLAPLGQCAGPIWWHVLFHSALQSVAHATPHSATSPALTVIRSPQESVTVTAVSISRPDGYVLPSGLLQLCYT